MKDIPGVTAGEETTPDAQMHNLRRAIDGLIQAFAYLKGNPPTVNESPRGARELAIVHTKLQEAKMWTGKVLEELGSELPVEFRDEANAEEGGGIA